MDDDCYDRQYNHWKPWLANERPVGDDGACGGMKRGAEPPPNQYTREKESHKVGNAQGQHLMKDKVQDGYLRQRVKYRPYGPQHRTFVAQFHFARYHFTHQIVSIGE